MSAIAAPERLERISAENGEPVARASENVFRAAGRSAEFYDHLRAHYRETRRTPVEIPAEIRLLTEDGALYAFGSATIRNISPSGALLADIRIDKDAYPVKPFKFEIVMKGGSYDGIGLEARPVRFEPQFRGLGVKFDEIFVTA
ncbi:MAG: hypothetical protein M5U26_10740 [Planctomycetota bacterium]|nr:hypothetical protein [Planctomycetota bacterium]